MHYSPWLDPTLSRRRYIWLCSTAALCLRLPRHSERSQTVRNFYEVRERKGDWGLKWDKSRSLSDRVSHCLFFIRRWPEVVSFSYHRPLLFESYFSKVRESTVAFKRLRFMVKDHNRNLKVERIEINYVDHAGRFPQSFPIKVRIITNNNYFA